MFSIKSFLDMSEDEQWDWLKANKIIDSRTHLLGIIERVIKIRVLADLAFRLRDEAVALDYLAGIDIVEQCILNKKDKDIVLPPSRKEMSKNASEWNGTLWWTLCAEPIHWIAAAIAAKEAE